MKSVCLFFITSTALYSFPEQERIMQLHEARIDAEVCSNGSCCLGGFIAAPAAVMSGGCALWHGGVYSIIIASVSGPCTAVLCPLSYLCSQRVKQLDREILQRQPVLIEGEPLLIKSLVYLEPKRPIMDYGALEGGAEYVHDVGDGDE